MSLILWWFLVGFVTSVITYALGARNQKYVTADDICMIGFGTVCGFVTPCFIGLFFVFLFWTHSFQFEDLFKNPFYKKEIKKWNDYTPNVHVVELNLLGLRIVNNVFQVNLV